MTFSNSSGVELSGVLSGSGDTCVILVHGFTSSKNSSTNIELEKRFNLQGIATFRFDIFGHGDSQGDFADITLSEAKDDILQAIEYVKSKGFTKIGLVGSSFGGNASILAAGESDDLFVLVLKCPVSDYVGKMVAQTDRYPLEEWKEKGFYLYRGERQLNYSFFADSEKIDSYEYARRIKVPTLIVHGDVDVTVPVEQSKKLVEEISNAKLEIVEGAGHRFEGEDFDVVVGMIEEFVIKNK
jgi:uncharacterized protein